MDKVLEGHHFLDLNDPKDALHPDYWSKSGPRLALTSIGLQTIGTLSAKTNLRKSLHHKVLA